MRLENTGIVDCQDLAPMYFSYDSAERCAQEYVSADADCTAGSGRFFLLPVLYNNLDKDGRYTATLLPIQQSGTGVMTRRAWISSISPVSPPSGSTLRVVKQTSLFHMTTQDTLYNASEISTLINGTTNFGSNVLRGDPPLCS